MLLTGGDEDNLIGHGEPCPSLDARLGTAWLSQEHATHFPDYAVGEGEYGQRTWAGAELADFALTPIPF